jgi:Arc/MetJ family transcription regulator
VPTNLNIDDKLIEQAVALGHHSSKREAVNAALREYVAYLGRLGAVEAFGTIDFDPTYDHKRIRSAR